MQYVEVEISEVVTLPMLPATSVKKVQRKIDESEESITLIKLGVCFRDTCRNSEIPKIFSNEDVKASVHKVKSNYSGYSI